MHYCFVLLSDIDSPVSFRMKNVGAALIRQGVRVSYIVDDNPTNRARGGIDPQAHLEFTSPRRGRASIKALRRAIQQLAPDYVEVLNPHPKSLLALRGLKNVRIVALWDEIRR